MTRFHRPVLTGPAIIEAVADDLDPQELVAAGHRIANLLVRGAHDPSDVALRERVVHLADDQGLGVIADLWSHASADTVAGALWRLYLLRTWVHRQPRQAALEFETGRAYAPVHEVLAGVVEPPGPDEVLELTDIVVGAILGEHLDVTLERAAAFAHIVGVGRGQLDSGDPHSAARLLDLARHLRRAAELERTGDLH